MADVGKISRARMEAYADQARRLGNVSGDLSPAQIEETLRGVTLSGGGGGSVTPTVLADVGVSGAYTHYGVWSLVADIDGSRLKIGGTSLEPANAYSYTTTTRLAYTDFDIPAKPLHNYRFIFETTVDDIIMLADFYTAAAMDKVNANQSIPNNDTYLTSSGWGANHVSGFVYYSNPAAATIRFAFSYYQNAVPFVGGEVSRVRIYESPI